MSLSIDNHPKTARANAETLAKVTAYLNGLYDVTAGVPANRRDAVADAYMKDNPLIVADKAAAVKRVDYLTRECENDAKSVSWRTKFYDRFGQKGKEIAKLAILGAVSAAGCVLAANGMAAASTAVVGAGLVVVQGQKELTDKEKADVEQYGAIKRGLFALKKMRAALTSESDGKGNAFASREQGVALRLKRNRER